MSVLTDAAYSKNIGEVRGGYAYSKVAARQESEAVSSEAAGSKKPDTDRAEFNRTPDISRMSDSERASLVQSLKADLNNQMARFTNIISQTFREQGITSIAAGDNSFWKFIAGGNYTVDTQTKEDAAQAVSEEGFWGVSQTSQRIFDFAYALAGDDAEKMKEMQAAVEKGFKQAGAAWGGELPSICGDTHTAVNKLFDEFYKSHGAE